MTNRIPAQCFHPGEYIRDEMEARGWNVADLAKHMSVHNMPVEIATSLIECKQDITVNIAFGLRRAFGTSADLWINLQKAFDVWQESRPTLRASVQSDQKCPFCLGDGYWDEGLEHYECDMCNGTGNANRPAGG